MLSAALLKVKGEMFAPQAASRMLTNLCRLCLVLAPGTIHAAAFEFGGQLAASDGCWKTGNDMECAVELIPRSSGRLQAPALLAAFNREIKVTDNRANAVRPVDGRLWDAVQRVKATEVTPADGAKVTLLLVFRNVDPQATQIAFDQLSPRGLTAIKQGGSPFSSVREAAASRTEALPAAAVEAANQAAVPAANAVPDATVMANSTLTGFNALDRGVASIDQTVANVSQTATGISQAAQGVSQAVDAARSLRSLFRRNRGAADSAPNNNSNAPQAASPGPACIPNKDVAAEVTTGDSCGPGNARDFKVFVHNRTSRAVNVLMEVTPAGSKPMNTGGGAFPPGARQMTACGTSATIKSCEFLAP